MVGKDLIGETPPRIIRVAIGIALLLLGWINMRMCIRYGRVVPSSFLQGICIAFLLVGVMLRLAVFKEM